MYKRRHGTSYRSEFHLLPPPTKKWYMTESAWETWITDSCKGVLKFLLWMCVSSVDGRVRRYDLRMGQLHVDYIGSEWLNYLAVSGRSLETSLIRLHACDLQVRSRVCVSVRMVSAPWAPAWMPVCVCWTRAQESCSESESQKSHTHTKSISSLLFTRFAPTLIGYFISSWCCVWFCYECIRDSSVAGFICWCFISLGVCVCVVFVNRYTGHQNKDYKLDCCLSEKDTHVLSCSEDGHVYCWDLVEVCEGHYTPLIHTQNVKHPHTHTAQENQSMWNTHMLQY